ncbi:protein traS [Salmonella enterica]|nr:protein traS [Salmonella enterica]
MKRSDLEKDADLILNSIRENDYEIPENKEIIKLALGRLKYVFLLQLLLVILDCFLYPEVSNYQYQVSKVLFLIFLSFCTVLFFSFVFLASIYNSLSMYLIIKDDVKVNSLLLKLVKQKVSFYGKLLLAINSIIGFILLFSGEYFIAGLGFSWFVTYLISMLALQTSLSRYMTPAVVSSLSKVKELLSASPK